MSVTIDSNKIRIVQTLLGITPSNGVYDEHTKAAVKNYSLRYGNGSSDVLTDAVYESITQRLGSDNEALSKLETEIYSDTSKSEDSDSTTDISETDAAFELFMLDSDEYVTSNGKVPKKEYLFLHHTSGWSNPYNTITDWNSDSRGRIGTHYVIGGHDIKTGKSDHDGRILKCIPDDYFGWHLGSTSKDGISMHMHVHSIGIEICNMGYLTQKGSAFYTYTGVRVPDANIVDLGFKFRGYQYWHKYTENQIESLYALIKSIEKKTGINTDLGLKAWISKVGAAKAFEFNQSARDGKVKGLLSHTNVRKDKSDVSPQKLLVEMINSL